MAVLKRDPPPLQQPIAHQGSLITTTPWALWFNKLLAVVEFAPADPDGAVQFNDGGAFGGSSAFRFNPIVPGLGIGTGSVPGSTGPVTGGGVGTSTLNVVTAITSLTTKSLGGAFSTTFTPVSNTAHSNVGLVSGFETDGAADIGRNQVAVSAEFYHNGTGRVERGHGLYGGAFTESSGPATNLFGGYLESGNYGTAQTDHMIGAICSIVLQGAGTMTNAYDLFVNGIDDTTTGTDVVTNLYGIYVRDITRGTTLNYALYTNAGDIRLGEIAAAPAQTYVVTVDDNGVLSSTATPPGAGITQLTGDVTAGPGSGSQVATIAAHAVTFAKMQTIATQTLIGRDTAGTGDPESISISQALDWLTT